MSGKSRVALWVGVALVALLLVCGGVVYLAGSMIRSWLGTGTDSQGIRDTQAACRVRVENGKVAFDVLYGQSVTGIVRFTVTDADGTPLWSLTGPGQGRPPKLVYGEVPSDPQLPWKQEFPVNGQPPEDIRGRRVRVRLDARYNIPFGPGVEIYEAEIDVPKEGSA